MEKILIIAEKWSQALVYAQWLFGQRNLSGTCEGKEIKIIPLSWHIITFKEPKEIIENIKWEYDILPLNIDQIPYKISAWKVWNRTKKEIYEEVKKELTSKYTAVINATDADREWSYIFWELYKITKSTLPVVRYYPKVLEPSVIKKEILSKFEDIEYDKRLFKAWETRSFIDYQFGNNNTILFSLKWGELIKVWRVKLAILSIIRKREQDIERFGESREYYNIEATFQKWDGFYTGILQTQKMYNRKEAENLLKLIEWYSIGQITELKAEEKQRSSHKLFNLISLSQKCSQVFWWNAKKTLTVGQALYDKWYMSYPRTKVEYLAESYIPDLKHKFNEFSKHYNLEIEYTFPWKRVFDNSKVKEHDAIRPIFQPNFDNKLTWDEQKLYQLLICHLIVVFSKNEISNTYKIITTSGNSIFATHIKDVIDEWWVWIERKLYKMFGFSNSKENGENTEDFESWKYQNLQNFSVNTMVSIAQPKIKIGKDNPPPLLTEVTLLKACEKPKSFLLESESNDDIIKFMPESWIGTPATLGDILEEMLENNIIKYTWKKYTTWENGTKLRAILPDKYKGLIMTAKIEYLLDLISEWKQTDKEVKQNYLQELREDIKNHKSIVPQMERKQWAMKIEWIVCPKCGNELIQVVSKKNGKTYAICSKSKQIEKWDCEFISEFDAENNTFIEQTFHGKETNLKCPNCKWGLEENDKTVFCKCGFTLWKNAYGKKFTKTELKEIVTHWVLENAQLKSKAWNDYTWTIVIDSKTWKMSLQFDEKK